MKFLLILGLIGIAGFSILGQKTQQQLEEEQRRLDKERQKQLEAQDGKKMGELDPRIFSPKISSEKFRFPTSQTAIEPNKEQKKRLHPSEDDFAKYSVFLKQRNTGLIKIFPNFDCTKIKNVIRADNPCLNEVPLSSFYSFRQKKYSLQELTDLEFKDNQFMSNGKLANGIIVSFGDVLLESVSLENKIMQMLSEFPPAKIEEEVTAKSVQLKDGIEIGGYLFTSAVEAKENNTYAIRVIAYNGKNLPKFPAPFNYEEEGDKRADIIVAFRVVKRNEDGSLTLLWKELRRKDSPKIKVTLAK